MALDQKLRLWQTDLIDVSRRNALLYYSDSGRGAGLRLRVPDVAAFFARLTSKRALSFDDIPTDLEEEDLTRKLSRFRTNARDDLNERGINTLYIACGLLEWRPAAASEEVEHAPLVLVPVTLKRQGVSGAFQLERLGDEDIEINPALREFLSQQFDLHLPTYEAEKRRLASDRGEERAAPTLAMLLRAVEGALRPDLKWTVLPEAHLGRFSFQKLVMYDDLRRNEGDVRAHPLLRALGGEGGPLPTPAGLVPADQLDTRVRPHDILEILDADSSQQEAIIAAKAGQSFVLQGPPGTGKSQTIANIIAECLGQSKRVLFVSEKMAALEVVRQRLRDAGLGEFLLDLHNPRKDKRIFTGELTAALQRSEMRARHTPLDWTHAADQLESRRGALNRYVEELHRPRFALGKSAFHALGALARLEDVADLDFPIERLETTTPADLEMAKQALGELSEYYDVLDAYDAYPWGETKVARFTLELEANINAHFGHLAAEIDSYESTLAPLIERLGETPNALTFGWAEHVRQWIERAVTGPRPPLQWLHPGEAARILPIARDAAERSRAYLANRAWLDPRYARACLELDHGALLAALTSEAEGTMRTLRASVPQDIALAHRTEIAERLRSARSTLPDLIAAGGAVAEALGLPTPTTPADAEEQLRWADAVLASPHLPREWLEPASFSVMRAGVKETDERYGEVARLRAALDSLYDPTYFALNLADCALRYKQRYQSFTRIFKPQYHQDSRRLRSLLKPGQTRTPAQMEADLYVAAELGNSEIWLRIHRTEHARLIGESFEGERTDWQQVRRALAWAENFQTLLAGDDPTAELIQLVMGPAKGLATVRARRDRLAELAERWREEVAALDGLLRVEALLPGMTTFDEAEAGALDTALARLRESLGAFWAAAEAVEAHRLADAPGATQTTEAGAWQRLRGDITMARDVAAFEAWLSERQEALAADLGPEFAGAQTAWAPLLAALEWAREFIATYPATPLPEGLAFTASRECPPTEHTDLRAALETAGACITSIEKELEFAETVLPREALLSGVRLPEAPLSDVRGRVTSYLEQLPCLARWLGCRVRLDRCEALGLGPLVVLGIDSERFPRDSYDLFERRFYTLWLDRARRESDVLLNFNGREHEEVIRHFRTLDGDHKALARDRLRARLAANRATVFDSARLAADPALGEAVTRLRREAAKKRHSSIRRIVNQVGPALLALKPCWMMSPLSVSQFVAASAPIFDVVIFDEASQVCPEDAICAILRGKQLIVVGDSKQLPPTRFFAKTLADGEDEEDGDEERAENERTESILDECQAVAFHPRSLRWHYRSQHESLIAFSNHHFYGGSLITFPGPAADHAAGVRWEYVADGVYLRSGARTNPREAERVVDLIAEYARAGKDLKKLGVVALSVAQQQAIKDAIEQRINLDPTLKATEDQLLGEDADGFFVKNLESVQGDERDIIMLSIGYARDRHGVLHTNFGPVNRKGGERRLNVAVTRAKHQMIVVASMHASELPTNLTSPGAKALRDYLDFAEHGPLVLPNQAIGGVTDGKGEAGLESPFEAAVYRALEAKGLSLATQVGCSSYRIDMAVRDPHNPGAYLLGIECDGATYHSSATARDRDRLRESVLRAMGWDILRIWSTDWRANPARQVERVLAKVERLQSKRPAPAKPPSPAAMKATPSDDSWDAPRAEAAGEWEPAAAVSTAITEAARPTITPAVEAARPHNSDVLAGGHVHDDDNGHHNGYAAQTSGQTGGERL